MTTYKLSLVANFYPIVDNIQFVKPNQKEYLKEESHGC